MRLQAGGVQRTGKPSGLKRVPYTVFSLHMEESNMKKMKRIISAALTLALAAGMRRLFVRNTCGFVRRRRLRRLVFRGARTHHSPRIPQQGLP